MKKLITLFIFLLSTFISYSCHNVTITETSAVDNGDGTYTYTFDFCVGIEDTYGFYFDFTGGNIVDWSTSITSPSTGTTVNPSVPPISGSGDIEYGDWDDNTSTLFSGATNDCMSITVTFDNPITSASIGGTQPDYFGGPCSGSTSDVTSCFASNADYVVTIETYGPCIGPNVSWELDGSTIESVSQGGYSTTWNYCDGCATTFSIDAPAGTSGNPSDRCPGGVQSYSVYDSNGILVASGGGDNSSTYGPDDVSCSPLPIELLIFDAKNTGDQNKLTWVTASEQNNDFFLVQRSQDGVNWEDVKVINGSGNSTNPITYRYFDGNFAKSVNFYRLKQVDFNGEYEYYGPVYVDNSTGIKVVKIVNILGQPVDKNYKGIIIIYYSNGKFEKRYR